MGWTVSRQRYWPDGTLAVEISPGSEAMSPGMLVPHWKSLGEGKEFADPNDAVEAALQVRRAWQKQMGKRVSLSFGDADLGYGTKTQKELEAWGEKTHAAAPKCDMCGDVMGPKRGRFFLTSDPDSEFCSEYCADKAADAQMAADAEYEKNQHTCDMCGVPVGPVQKKRYADRLIAKRLDASLATEPHMSKLKPKLWADLAAEMATDPDSVYCSTSCVDKANAIARTYEKNPKAFRVHLDNLEDRDGMVMVSVHGPGALAWAKQDQSIGGSRWEGAGDDDFAYTLVDDHPGLVKELKKEGYALNLDAYQPPEG